MVEISDHSSKQSHPRFHKSRLALAVERYWLRKDPWVEELLCSRVIAVEKSQKVHEDVYIDELMSPG